MNGDVKVVLVVTVCAGMRSAWSTEAEWEFSYSRAPPVDEGEAQYSSSVYRVENIVVKCGL